METKKRAGWVPINVLIDELNTLPHLKQFASSNGYARGYAYLCGQEVLLKRLITKFSNRDHTLTNPKNDQ